MRNIILYDERLGLAAERLSSPARRVKAESLFTHILREKSRLVHRGIAASGATKGSAALLSYVVDEAANLDAL